jgi:hypothetical protein
MKPLPWLACILFLLTSCSALQNAGIEKRKYTKGFYFDRPSHSKEVVKAVSSNDSVQTFTVKTTPPVSIQREEKTPAVKPAVKNAITGLPGANLKARLKKISVFRNLLSKNPQKSFSLRKNIPGPGEHSNTKAKRKHPTTWADVLFELIFRILVVLLALLIIAMFPGMPIALAEIISVLFLVGVCFLLYLWSEKK